jgi:magnesium transporter
MLAGIYGMNFEWMPELRWHYAYVACLGLMAIIAVVEVWIFYRCGWFD